MEAFLYVLCFVVGGIISLILESRRGTKRSGLSGTDQHNDTTDGLIREAEREAERAAGNNRELADAERRTAEIIAEQAETIGRAAGNNRELAEDNKTITELIQRGKEILDAHKPVD